VDEIRRWLNEGIFKRDPNSAWSTYLYSKERICFIGYILAVIFPLAAIFIIAPLEIKVGRNASATRILKVAIFFLWIQGALVILWLLNQM